MAQHTVFGKKGEELAAAWLTEKGYEILECNWREGRRELDIIARLKNVYHFIEVKTRRSGKYGYPEERVGKKKIRDMMRAASAWLYQRRGQNRGCRGLRPGCRGKERVQYDVLSVTFDPVSEPEFFFIEDIYA